MGLKWPFSCLSDNIALEHLRYIRDAIGRVQQDISDMKIRVGRVETNLAQVQVHLAEHSTRFDRVEARLDRIDRRLELAPADC